MDPENAKDTPIWVHGEGGWGLMPSIHYRFPSDVFDFHMLMGSLETIDDLEILLDQVRSQRLDDESEQLRSFTDVWVAGDTWSGSPSVFYEIPKDVFSALINSGTAIQDEIGKITCQLDLDNLIKFVRENGAASLKTSNSATEKCATINIESKLCGHECFVSSIKQGCCRCMDRRPLRDEGTYPQYIDGCGWIDNASRGSGYCPHCKY